MTLADRPRLTHDAPTLATADTPEAMTKEARRTSIPSNLVTTRHASSADAESITALMNQMCECTSAPSFLDKVDEAHTLSWIVTQLQTDYPLLVALIGNRPVALGMLTPFRDAESTGYEL